MKLLDLERKGNVVRFYLGVDELEKWWGDDWDDAPYEHNAGPIYERFILAEADAVFPFDCGLCNAHDILQPGETYQHKRWMPKEHYIKSDEPYLVALPDEPYCAGYASWNASRMFQRFSVSASVCRGMNATAQSRRRAVF